MCGEFHSASGASLGGVDVGLEVERRVPTTLVLESLESRCTGAAQPRRDTRFHLRKGRNESRRGFTMIEVILALALFSIAVMFLAGSYINVLNNLELVKVDQALEDDLALVRSQVQLQPDLKEIEKGGEFPTIGNGLATWTVVAVPSERVSDLFRVEITVQLPGTGDAPKPRSVTQTMYLLRPDWAEPTDRDNIRAERKKTLEETKRTRPL